MIRLAIVALLLILPIGGGTGASDQVLAVFEREIIELVIGEGSIQVTGTYQFMNHSDSARIQGLYYPLPVDSTHLFPDRIVVTLGRDTLAHRVTPAAVMFKVPLPANGRAVFTVSYHQPCRENSACYILTSTQAWDRPLDQADFLIRVPDSLALTAVSYDIEEVVKSNGETTHRFSRQEFMPDRDLCVRWQVKPDPAN